MEQIDFTAMARRLRDAAAELHRRIAADEDAPETAAILHRHARRIENYAEALEPGADKRSTDAEAA